MSRKLSNSKMLPFVYITNPSTPIADQLTGENQFRSSTVGGRMEPVLQMLFLNIAPLLFTAPGLLGATLPSSSSPAVCLHLPLGPRGKPQTSISFHAETGLGAPKCSHLLGDDPAPAAFTPHGFWIHHRNLGNWKDGEEPCAPDPIWDFQSVNQPSGIFKHKHCVRQELQNIIPAACKLQVNWADDIKAVAINEWNMTGHLLNYTPEAIRNVKFQRRLRQGQWALLSQSPIKTYRMRDNSSSIWL